MMVVAVMAGALHLFQTLRENPMACQISIRVRFGLRLAQAKEENGAVQARTRWAVAAVAILCVCVAGNAQNQDRDTRGVPKTSASAPPPEARIDINHATVEELVKVPGLTRSWAGRIVRFRPYRTKQDLLEKGVLNSQVYDRIKDYVIAHRDKQ
jgi:DNA uptake protein ComE-like DNA-binding protein